MGNRPDLYVSPHLDDVALSCGATIHHVSRAAGEQAPRERSAAPSRPVFPVQDRKPVVVSVFAAPLRLRSELPQAIRYHGLMGLGPGSDPLLRRREDGRAMAHLGARAVQLDFEDCIYRRTSSGEPLVSDDDDVFLAGAGGSAQGLGEESLIEEISTSLGQLMEEISPGRVVLPLSLGDHRDHLLARSAGEQAWRTSGPSAELWYFEDAPYCLRSGVAETAAGYAPAGSEPVLFSLSSDDLRARLAAVAEYGSQQAVIWDGDEPLAEAILRRAADLGEGAERPAERQWRAQR